MLLRGVYTFEPRPEDHNHTLSFSCNDNLIFLEVLKHDSNWIKVVDILGRIGYVPKSFTVPDDNFDDYDLILTFLVDAVVKARQKDLSCASALERLRDEIRDYPSIIEKRSTDMMKVFRSESKSYCGPKARKSTSDLTINKQLVREYFPSSSQSRRISSELDCRTGSRPEEAKTRQSYPPQGNCDTGRRYIRISDDSSVKTITETEAEDIRDDKNVLYGSSSSNSLQEIKSRLVNVVQETCSLGPKVSEDLLVEVFQQIKESSSNLPVESILDKLTTRTSQKSDPAIIELEKVVKCMSNLSKDMIKERKSPSSRTRPSNNYSECSENLDKLRKLFIENDPSKVVPILQADQYGFCVDLAHVYLFDSPVNLKEKLLDVFLIICTLDRKGRKAFLSTTLPLYLGRELMAGAGTKGKLVFKQQMELLTSLLTCGSIMPESHFEILGTGFVNFLLQELEDAFGNSRGDWEHEKLTGDYISPLVNLILAYNLQFEAANTKNNIVLKVLAECRMKPKGFYAVVIQLFKDASRDPLRSEIQDDNLLYHSNYTNSVFKMVNEICLCQRTKAQLTTNDIQELMTAIRDGLMENSAGSVRLGYLQVLQALLDNFQGNFRDIRAALLSILLENDPLAFPEQGLIRAISKEFPRLFLQSISRIKIDVHGENEDDNNDHRQEDNFNDYSYLSS